MDVTRTRRLGLPVLVIGLLGIALAQWVAPLAAPPLYDGVVVAEPYRWLVPPPGEHGAPTSASATLRPIGEASPLLALATAEEPPQAQVFGTDGALVLPAGTSSIKVSITPILPASLPNEGHIAGNVYRIAVTNQKGVPITAPASAQVTVVIRGPDGTVGATIERYADGAWKTLKTEETGFRRPVSRGGHRLRRLHARRLGSRWPIPDGDGIGIDTFGVVRRPCQLAGFLCGRGRLSRVSRAVGERDLSDIPAAERR